MKQYEDNPSAPKITPNVVATLDKKLVGRVAELEAKIAEQDQIIHRMHRDIVRLREAINQVSARIK